MKPIQEWNFDELMDAYDYGIRELAEAELRRRVEGESSLRVAINDLIKVWTERAGHETPSQTSTLALCALELKSLLGRSGQFAAVKEGV